MTALALRIGTLLSTWPARSLFTTAIALFLAVSAYAEDGADAPRAINKQVLELIQTAKFPEAEELAKKGLALCETAGSAKVFCISQFNDSLGDIALAQKRYAEALGFFQTSYQIRAMNLSAEHPLIARSQLRLGHAYSFLDRITEAEVAFKAAAVGFENVVPTDRALGVALSNLRKIYADSGRFEQAIEAGRRAALIFGATEDNNGTSRFSELVSVCAILVSTERYVEAEAEARKTLAEADKLPEGHPARGWAARAMAYALAEQRHVKEAESFATAALASEKRQSPINAEDLLLALYALDRIYRLEQRYEEELPLLQRARSLAIEKYGVPSREAARPLVGEATANDFLHRFEAAEALLHQAFDELANFPRSAVALEAHFIFADTLVQRSRYPEAEAHLKEAYDKSDILPDAEGFRLKLFRLFAILYADWKKPKEAVSYAERAVVLLQARKANGHTIGETLITLGRAQLQLRRYSDALATFERARQVLESDSPEDDPQRAEALLWIGQLYYQQEEYAKSETAYRAALDLANRFAYPDTGWRAGILRGLAMAYRDTARYDEAENLLAEAVKLDEMAGPERLSALADKLRELASIWRRQGRLVEAEQPLLRALSIENSGPSDPEQRAAILNALGLIYSSTDQYDKAEPMLHEALALRRALLPADDPLTAETLGNVASVDQSRGRYAKAEAELREALGIVEARGPPQSTNIALHAAWLGNFLRAEDKLDEAETLIRRALAIYEQRFGQSHPRTAGAIKSLAQIEIGRGRDHEAEDLYQRAMAVDQRAVGADSLAIAGDLLDLAPILRRSGKWQEPKAAIDRALAIQTARLGEDSPIRSTALLAKAGLAYAEGRSEGARRLAEQALRLQQRALGETANPVIAGTLALLAHIDILDGRLDDAAAALGRAAEIDAGTLPPNHPFRIGRLQAWAALASAQGDHAAAEDYSRQALTLAEHVFGFDHPTRQEAVDGVVKILWLQGKFAEADQLRNDTLAGTEKQLGHDHPATARALHGVAAVLANSARLDEATASERRALTIDEAAFGVDSRQVAIDHLAIGSILRRGGQFAEAAAEIDRALWIWNNHANPLAASLASEQLAFLAGDQAREGEALALMEGVVRTREQQYGSDSPSLCPSLASLGKLYLNAGRTADAEQIADQIATLVGPGAGDDVPRALPLLELRAALEAKHGAFDASEKLFRRAIAVAGKLSGRNSGVVALEEYNLATMQIGSGRYQEAVEGYGRALEIFKRESGANSPNVGYTLLAASKAYAALGDSERTALLLANAIRILGQVMVEQRPAPKWL